MNAEPSSSSRSLGKTLVAGLILVVAGWLVLHFVIHLVVFVATIAVVVLAVVALDVGAAGPLLGVPPARRWPTS